MVVISAIIIGLTIYHQLGGGDKGMLLIEVIDDFADNLRLIDRSKETIKGYERELRDFNRFLSEKYNYPVFIDDVTLMDIEAYQLYEKERGIASASRSRSLYILRSFYNYCCNREICAKNIAESLEPVKVRQKEPDFLTFEEFKQLSGAIKQAVIKTVVQTMFYSGGRISEIVGLRLEDVDMENKIIYIYEGKGGKDRKVPIGDALYKILTNYLENIRKTKYKSDRFFALWRTGKVSASYVNRIISEAAEKLGFEKKVSSHVLRHSFASNLARRGVSLVSIQKLLGHSDLRTTSRYLHENLDQLSQDVNVL